MKPTRHRMTRRCTVHDYSSPGLYHITIHVAEQLGMPFGHIVGNAAATDGTPEAPHVILSPIGQMVEHELQHSIGKYYPMIEVQDHVVMPEHIHVIIEVHDTLVSPSGKKANLGQVIAGFKKGCNRRYWEMTNQGTAANQEAVASQETVDNQEAVANQGKPDCTNSNRQAHAVAAETGKTPAPAVAVGASAVFPQSSPPPLPVFPQNSPPPLPAFPQNSPPPLPAFPQGSSSRQAKVPSSASSGRQPLFAPGYCDVMPLHRGQLATQRAYIKDNPRNRLLRMSNRAWLAPRRNSIATALTTSALRGYLQRECPPHLATPDVLAAIEAQLLIAGSGKTAAAPTAAQDGKTTPTAAQVLKTAAATTTAQDGKTAAATTAAQGGKTAAAPFSVGASAVSPQSPPRSFIACDTYGNTALLTAHRCLPIVCHRKDAKRLSEQKARCLEEAARGTVFISARIAPGEQAIIDALVHDGFPVVLICDNGFPDRFHPSADRLALCAAGRLLLITPWSYHYRAKDASLNVPYCKTMNCVAQALCRTRDSWWQQP